MWAGFRVSGFNSSTRPPGVQILFMLPLCQSGFVCRMEPRWVQMSHTHMTTSKGKGKSPERQRKEKKEKCFLEALQQIFPCVLLASGLGDIPVPKLLTADLKATLNHIRYLPQAEKKVEYWKSTQTQGDRPYSVPTDCVTRSVSPVIPDLWCCHDTPEI